MKKFQRDTCLSEFTCLPGSRVLFSILAGFLLLFFSGCTLHEKGFQVKDPHYVVVNKSSSGLITDFAPVFVLSDWQMPYNRIGRVVAERVDGDDKVAINPDQAVVYGDKFTFSTQQGSYINLVYRVHFQKTPFSLIPFHLGAGNNVGLLVIVTLSEEHIPLLVTTVNTCGCYAAVVPTNALPSGSYPEDWVDGDQHIFGEVLPNTVAGYDVDNRLLITVRPGVHRVMNISINGFTSVEKNIIPAKLMRLKSLKMLPIENGEVTSFYHETWPLRGHVKGAVKPWESLLLSLVSLDFYVGMDKEYGNTVQSGNPFYTSLLPWNRHVSDMNDFAQFLRFQGWRL